MAVRRQLPELGSYLYLATIYFAVVGTLYLWGYWGYFGINALQYMGVADIVKSTLYPVTGTVIVVLICVTVAAIATAISAPTIVRKFTNYTKKELEAEVSLAEMFSDERHRALRILFIVMLASGVISGIFLYALGYFLLWVSFVMGFIAAYSLSRTSLLRKIDNYLMRLSLLLVFCMLPFAAFSQGHYETKEIYTAQEKTYVAAASQLQVFESLKAIPSNADWNFLGQLGDTVFFLSADRKSIILAQWDRSRGFEGILLRHQ